MTRHEKLIKSLLATPEFVNPINMYCKNELARAEKEVQDRFTYWLSEIGPKEIYAHVEKHAGSMYKELNKKYKNMHQLFKREVEAEMERLNRFKPVEMIDLLERMKFILDDSNELQIQHKDLMQQIKRDGDYIGELKEQLKDVRCMCPWQKLKRWIKGK